MKRDEKSRCFPYHPRPFFQRQESCGSLGTSSSSISCSGAGSTADSTTTSTIITIVGGGNGKDNSSFSSSTSSRATSSENAESFDSHVSVIRNPNETILLHHSDVLDINDPSSTGNHYYDHFNFCNSEDMKELLCVLEDLD